MATVKSYTSLEQSQRLAKILNHETADMEFMFLKKDNSMVGRVPFVKDGYEEPDCGYNIVPCWSLAALLSVIPKPDLVQNSEGTWLLHSWVNDYPWSVGGYSNPVDACYEMILKLHELNLL